ncbi:glycosyltransferase, partial [Methylopila musalis]
MTRVLLAWEGGAGRGHLLHLRAVAEALGDRFVFDAALCRMEHAGEIAPLCDAVFQGAALYDREPRRRGPGAVGAATWGEFMGDMGFGDAEVLRVQIGWWIAAIEARGADLVAADFAPCALLAARALGLPTIVTGVGYAVPPPDLAVFPVFLSDRTARLHDEAAMVAAVNAAGAGFGLTPIARLAEVYRADVALVRTLPMLDPYDGLRTDPLAPPLADVPAAPSDGEGDEVFAYFSTTERDDAALMEAICDLGKPVRLFLPRADDALADALAARGVIVERAPVPVDLIARRSRLALHAGQHGALCMALACGLPQVAAPQHLEQLYHARRAEAAGVLTVLPRAERDPAALRAAIRAAF